MNKQEIIYAGNQLLNITDLLELQEHFETWKVRVLEYAKDYNELLGHCRMQLHM